MKERMTRSVGVVKTTAIGGVFFLLPLVVVGALIGQLVQIVWVVAESVHQYLPVKTLAGYSLLLAGSIVLILAACFFAGIVARRSLGRRFTESIEKYLLMLFPRYAIFKEQLTGNIGGEVLHNQLKPVMVHLPEGRRLGMEVERDNDGGIESVTVYMPGSPDPWSGVVLVVDAARVTTLSVPFSEAMATVEQLGRGSLRLLKR